LIADQIGALTLLGFGDPDSVHNALASKVPPDQYPLSAGVLALQQGDLNAALDLLARARPGDAVDEFSRIFLLALLSTADPSLSDEERTEALTTWCETQLPILGDLMSEFTQDWERLLVLNALVRLQIFIDAIAPNFSEETRRLLESSANTLSVGGDPSQVIERMTKLHTQLIFQS
jgi:hypothetical protein